MDLTNTDRARPRIRRLNEQAVLDAVFAFGPTGRVEISRRTGLSKPTVSSIVEELVRLGLVRLDGTSIEGRVGRASQLYRVDGHVGYVIGVDLGGTKIRAAISDLYGVVLEEVAEPTAQTGAGDVIRQIVRLARDLGQRSGVDSTRVRVLSVGTPGTVNPKTGEISLAFNIPPFADVPLAKELAAETHLAVVVENDVNAAAVGERWKGIAQRSDNFVFLAIGTGVGMGIVINGELWRGARGAAGEVGYLPLGEDPFDVAFRKRGWFEEAIAGSGIVRRVERELKRGTNSQLMPGVNAVAIFDAAVKGDAVALKVVDEEARDVALGIAAIAAVLAPELVVLGGGIGASPLLLAPVRKYVEELVPQPVRVESSGLGHRASLVGALAIGLDEARSSVFPAAEASATRPIATGSFMHTAAPEEGQASDG